MQTESNYIGRIDPFGKKENYHPTMLKLIAEQSDNLGELGQLVQEMYEKTQTETKHMNQRIDELTELLSDEDGLLKYTQERENQ